MVKTMDHLNHAPEEEVAGGDGLNHYGDPEVEVIVDEEPEVEVLEEEDPKGRWEMDPEY